ncbi:MAG: DNA helicase RecG [Candidatus Moranbacteria bacterium CG_4_9_14_3_um_filter_42_9]|nr:MAG: DNA helicase RecG [Candidatus Moranbacteria bacterium CG_4_9_14_3_um_filter_42_9]
MIITPKTLLQNIPKINPNYAKVLEKLGLLTVEELLLYFPFRYDDFSKTVALDEKYLGQVVTIEGRVAKAKVNRIFRRRLTITEVVIQDKNNLPLKAAWFNQPYLKELMPEGTELRLSGKLEKKGKYFVMTGPAWEKASRDATNTGRLVPVYRETRGLTSKWLRWQIKPLLDQLGHPMSKLMIDPIPRETLEKLNLPPMENALRYIHFPATVNQYLLARKRFAFQEMFLVQLKSLQIKKEWENNNSVRIKFDEDLIKKFVSDLPFKLTNAQRKASFEILKDLEKSRPMNRLLNGDVGSGKTVVAAIAALQAINTGYQAAIMAPTEVLARQHFENFNKLFKNYNLKIALLTNSYKLLGDKGEGRPSLLKMIGSGEIDLLIGTHAIIQKDVKFKNLVLVIIDEQHRFGVAQRALLQQETMDIQDGIKSIPHLLTMTATPIPRTLAIAFSGSLDISILDEMPKDRKKIVTQVIPPENRQSIYNFVRSEISSGRQVFVIFPLIEESKILTEIKAATIEHKKLSDIFPEFSIGLLHGRLPAQGRSASGGKLSKEQVMNDFKSGKYDILVSTSVVEVGIDIPNAAVMIIEDAERFGLSQLHQFRGRVGRGEHQSYCYLFTGSSSETATKRLQSLEETNDGFEIAQKDLELRGPGQFFGTIQSGLPDIAMENLTNVKLIKFSQMEAKDLLAKDPELKKHPATREALLKFSQKIHLE